MLKTKDAIIKNIRDGELKVIGFDDASLQGAFDKGLQVSFNGGRKYGTACLTYKDWLGGPGGVVNVKDAVMNFHLDKFTGDSGCAKALQVVAHELRHFTFENSNMSPSGGYGCMQETDAGLVGEEIRKNYGY